MDAFYQLNLDEVDWQLAYSRTHAHAETDPLAPSLVPERTPPSQKARSARGGEAEHRKVFTSTTHSNSDSEDEDGSSGGIRQNLAKIDPANPTYLQPDMVMGEPFPPPICHALAQ